jgi:hypothetical protein
MTIRHKEHVLPSISRQAEQSIPDPVAPIAELMSTFSAPWALCGGWAVDAWLGRQTRDHLDVDLCVFIQDQRALYDHLVDWQLVAHGPTATLDTNERWDGQRLDLPVHLHGRLDLEEEVPAGILMPQQGFILDVQFGDRVGDDWILSSTAVWESQVNHQLEIPVPLQNGIRPSPWNVPTVVPEVLLLFKATAYFGIEEQMTGGRYQDEPDLLALLPHLPTVRRHWLRESIASIHREHPWLSALP